MGRRALIAAVVAAAAVAGCGGDDEPEGASTIPPPAEPETAIVVVGGGAADGVVTNEDLDRAVAFDALASGQEPPIAESPEYDLLAGEALDELVLGVWVRAEAAERGIAVSDEEVAAGIGEADQVARESGYCDGVEEGAPATECPDLLERYRTELLADRVAEEVDDAELERAWGPVTECLTELVSSLCGGGETVPPPDIPPASG